MDQPNKSPTALTGNKLARLLAENFHPAPLFEAYIRAILSFVTYVWAQ